MPKAFSEHEKELIRARLLEQGEKLFSTFGLKKTSIEELATAAGISKAAFYIFYESKEALFMDVVELAEQRFRLEILEEVNVPGSSPRARLFSIFKKAFGILQAIPLLRFFTSSDYEQVFRRVPPEKLQEHLTNDMAFIVELVAQCKSAGIPIQVPAVQIVGLLFPLVLAVLHEEDLSQYAIAGSIDMHLELIAAFCLGEVELQVVEERK